MLYTLGALAALIFGVTLSACAAMGNRPHGKWLQRVKASPSYRGAKFHNSQQTEVMMSSRSFFSTLGQWVAGKQVRTPAQPPAVVRPTPEQLAQAPAGGLRVTWLGHASALVELDGFRVLTDPVFSERVTPVRGVGPRRFFPSPLEPGRLPMLDAVVISHDHYDHLDKASVEALVGRTRTFVVPLGVGAILAGWDIPEEKIVELDWWQQATPVKGLRLICTPARHFSGRGVLDRDKTLWASWVLAGPKNRVYFGGDTGMFEGFREIGRRLGPFQLSLMPIGAYGEGWPAIHLNPEEAVRAHEMVGGGVLLPIHWGTFNLALHSWTEPAERLRVAARAASVEFALPRPGEAVVPGTPLPLRRWWPEVPWQPAAAGQASAPGERGVVGWRRKRGVPPA